MYEMVWIEANFLYLEILWICLIFSQNLLMVKQDADFWDIYT